MICGVGRRCGLDLALLWLWHRLAATAWIRPLAWEPPHAMGVALNRQKTKKKKKFEVSLTYIVMPISTVQQSDSVTHIYYFLYSFPSWSMPGDWIYSPVQYSRTLLCIHSMYNSLHLLIPKSQSIPLHPHPPLATTSLFSMSLSLFLFLNCSFRVPVVAQLLMNLTRNHEVSGSIPGLAQRVEDPVLP